MLLQLAGAEDGVHQLLRAPFLAACHKALQDSANAHAPGGGAAAKLGRDLARQAALLQVGWARALRRLCVYGLPCMPLVHGKSHGQILCQLACVCMTTLFTRAFPCRC